MRSSNGTVKCAVDGRTEDNLQSLIGEHKVQSLTHVKLHSQPLKGLSYIPSPLRKTVVNQDTQLFSGYKILPRSKTAKQSRNTTYSSQWHTSSQALAKHSLIICLQLSKVKYHFQGTEKIKTILETFPKLNCAPCS